MSKEEKVSEDVAELREVLNVISEFVDKLPKILNELISALYAADIGEKLGKSVGEYYKRLKESGIPDDIAIKLTEAYAKEAQTPMKILGELISRFGGGGDLRKELEALKEMKKKRLEELEEEKGGAEEAKKN